MTDRKLILPTELKVCATCTYWDGIRSLDDELGVVVVSECCEGECLVREALVPGLRAMYQDVDCLWDDLHVDEPADEPQADDDQAPKPDN